MRQHTITLTVNNEAVEATVPSRRLLSDFSIQFSSCVSKPRPRICSDSGSAAISAASAPHIGNK